MVNGNLSLAIDVIGKLWLRAYLVLKLQVKFAVICIFATRTIIMHLESDVFIRFANSVASYLCSDEIKLSELVNQMINFLFARLRVAQLPFFRFGGVLTSEWHGVCDQRLVLMAHQALF